MSQPPQSFAEALAAWMEHPWSDKVVYIRTGPYGTDCGNCGTHLPRESEHYCTVTQPPELGEADETEDERRP